MRHLHLLIASAFLIISHVLQAQQYSAKFGKPTTYELKMDAYSKDTTAEAVILYDKNTHNMEYSMSKQFFVINSDYARKIKILKSPGVKHANVAIKYYDRAFVIEERIVNIEGWVYNMENGKMVKTKLDKSFIFNEKASNGWNVIKFTLPGVKVGSVFEYKYTKTSDRIEILPDFETQSTIPIVKGEYQIEIPEYFKFRNQMKGYETIDFSVDEVTRSVPGTDLNFISKQVNCTTKNIPALKAEPYVWNVADYSSGVTFELTGVDLPGNLRFNFSNTWEAVEFSLKNHYDLYSNINSTTPYKDEVTTLMSATGNEIALLSEILAMVKSKIRWDGQYSFLENHPREAIKNGTGNNAQINSVIYRCLEMAGFKPYIVVLSPREYGRISAFHPTINSLNSYIIGVDLSNGHSVYMDGSSTFGGINVLPQNLMVSQARKINASQDKWVDLTQIAKNSTMRVQMIRIDSTGVMKARLSNYYSSNVAYDYRKRMSIHSDSTAVLTELHENPNVTVDSIKVSGTHPANNTIEEVIDFSEKMNMNGDFIYINPLYIPHFTEHPFTQSERKLPIEFSYPNSFTIVTTLLIPRGYTISDLPKSEVRTFEDKSISVSYLIQKPSEQMVQLKYEFLLKKTIYPNTYYDMMKEIFDFAATKNKDLIVLKKTTI